jgi:hypothetical protein
MYRSPTHLNLIQSENQCGVRICFDFNVVVGSRMFSFYYVLVHYRSRDSVVGIVTGYGLDDKEFEVRVQVWSKILSLRHPDQLWGPPNFLSTGYQGLFPQG